ncbi:MAG: enterotoxin [Acidobacteriota bacterium]|nr:enterotoxin [Acidobacteriota bacterium]
MQVVRGVVLAFWLGCAGTSVAAAQQSDQLANASVQVTWQAKGGHLRDVAVTDLATHQRVVLASAFALELAEEGVVRAEDLTLTAAPMVHALPADPNAVRAAERDSGEEMTATLADAAGALRVLYRLQLRAGSGYVRQEVTISAPQHDLAIRRVQLIDVHAAGVRVEGVTAGSPLVAGNFFLGLEHPLAVSRARQDEGSAWLERTLPLQHGQSITYSAVIGVAAPGQLRRGFLAYLERERAHPYRTFLHYNTWLDAPAFQPYDEAFAIDRVRRFGEELSVKRGVTLDSFLFDDGWDNHASLWQFHAGFPQGFTAVRQAAAEFHAAPGVWMSPWGGYSKPRQERIAYGRTQGYEVVRDGYALSGPRYYDAFRDVCLKMIREYGVNQFKFDGTGNADSVFPGSRFDSDFSAMIHLIGELRAAKPDIYINLTTGTDASPFWVLYADSIWRGGEDSDFAGVGTKRQQWITYRDGDVYAHIVQRGPLYPLNSLMLHGILYAQGRPGLEADPGNDFASEVRSYFGSGTQLQELYVTPTLLTAQNWDDLAEAAKWSRRNADVLQDTHWVGGDPNWLQIYGWAAWSPRKAILTLRNPGAQTASITLDAGRVLELPAGAAQVYRAHSPWHQDAAQPSLQLRAGQPHTFTLAPFAVLTLDLEPQR